MALSARRLLRHRRRHNESAEPVGMAAERAFAPGRQLLPRRERGDIAARQRGGTAFVWPREFPWRNLGGPPDVHSALAAPTDASGIPRPPATHLAVRQSTDGRRNNTRWRTSEAYQSTAAPACARQRRRGLAPSASASASPWLTWARPC